MIEEIGNYKRWEEHVKGMAETRVPKVMREYRPRGERDRGKASRANIPEIVKKKWDNLRDRFVRALRDSTAIPPSGSGAQQKKNNFSLYNSMLWFAPYIRKRKMTSTVSSLDVTPSTSVEATSEAIHLSDDASTSTESPPPMQGSSLGGSFQEEFRPKRANLHIPSLKLLILLRLLWQRGNIQDQVTSIS
ncbi:hypothetical protein ANN_26877 [Periplaneta americana]|uniref:MADF domain-containing protein n=1 Tax=Periplaneta americana TaxID=6978 RepID=A0ABQ8RWK8_PERAM|nr:hypothetical protein ANN_26877 [Periplaneta americana]